MPLIMQKIVICGIYANLSDVLNPYSIASMLVIQAINVLKAIFINRVILSVLVHVGQLLELSCAKATA